MRPRPEDSLIDFAIYSHPRLNNDAVKVGFSYPAFFFLGFWAMALGLWHLVVLVAIFSFTLISFTEDYYIAVKASVLVMQIYFGKNGNLWKRNHLLDQGSLVSQRLIE